MRQPMWLVMFALSAVMCVQCSGETPGQPEAPATPDKTPAAKQEVAAAAVTVAGWRGDGTGCFPKATPPTTWNEEEKKGILWRVKVGMGQSSPVIAGSYIFVTAEEDDLICVDRRTVKVLWKKTNDFKSLPKTMKVTAKRLPSDAGYSTATPATDGKCVYASHGTGIVVCYDLAGNRKWVRYLNLPQMTEYGRSASPVLVDGKLIVSISHLHALDAATGETLWEAKDIVSSYYGTPVVATIGGVKIIVTPNGNCVRVRDGKVLATEVGGVEYNSPIVDGDVVYFISATASAVRLASAEGKLKATTLWETEDMEGEFFASPVLHDGRIYAVPNEGVLFALDAKKGKILWHKELPIPSAGGLAGQPANLYASLAIAGGHLYLTNDTGTMLVLKPGAEYRKVSRNELDEGSGASPVFDGKRLYLRGEETLYCIGAKR